MLLDAAIVTLIVGVLIGRGKLVRLRELDLRAPLVFVLAAVVKIAVGVAGARGLGLAAQVGPPANMVSYLLVLLGLLLNRHLWAMRMVSVGVLLNSLVIFANGGSMPVDRALAERAGNVGLVRLLDQASLQSERGRSGGTATYVGHKAVTERTRLRPLADVVLLPMLVPRPQWWSPGSIGDIFMTVGTCWLMLSATGAFGLRTAARTGAAEGGPTGRDAP